MAEPTAETQPSSFVPALIIVDLQEAFCPPNGTLPVPHARSIIPTVNTLLSLPFSLKLATKDWHPQSHISFASNHPSASPFTSFTTITNPSNPEEKYETRLWPDHCVQGTQGAELIQGVEWGRLDGGGGNGGVVEKGMDANTEMYSAFCDPFRNPRGEGSGLKERLRIAGVTDVFVVGLAFDYCVKSTAVDAAELGFRTWVIREGTRGVDAGDDESVEKALTSKGVKVVEMEGVEVGWVKELNQPTARLIFLA